MGSSQIAHGTGTIQGLSCYQLDPLQDPRWSQLVEKHPRASVFHSVAWLRALRCTYGYEPVVLTTCAPSGDLKNGLVFCRINSWLTGRRLVSLPFSDHCEPLFDSANELNIVIQNLKSVMEQGEWKYLQLRPVNAILGLREGETRWQPVQEFYFHSLDLRPDLNQIFDALDKDSVQRRIQRAERGGLVEKCGRSEILLKDFYRLFLITRRRQRVPPTPHKWFHNLIRDLDKALEIRAAYKDGVPIAAILTLQFRDILYYKYGCSDEKFNNYGATPWLFWRAIACAKIEGFTEFDLGRTEQNNPGLLAFKNRWVPNPRRLIYWQYPSAAHSKLPENWKGKVVKSAFSLLPGNLQIVIGKWLYPHVG
jgi:hypothetical protein